MEDDRRYFTFAVFNERPLDAKLVEKLRFRFRINIDSAIGVVPGPGLRDQLISLSPERQFHSSEKRGVRRKFVVTHSNIKKVCVQLDGKGPFVWFRSFWRLVCNFFIRKRFATKLHG